MPNTTLLTLEQKIAAFLDKVNSSIDTNDISFQEECRTERDVLIGFKFVANTTSFDTDCLLIKPSDATRAIMDKASKDIFGATLEANNIESAFWVVPA